MTLSDNNESITLIEYGEPKQVTLTPEQHTYIKEKVNREKGGEIN